MNKYFKYYFFLLFFLFTFNILFSESWFFKNAHSKDINGKARIIDGDSIEINNKKIRFLGIDAFEKKQECLKKNGTKYKCGEVAISNLTAIISGQHVNCITKKKGSIQKMASNLLYW